MVLGPLDLSGGCAREVSARDSRFALVNLGAVCGVLDLPANSRVSLDADRFLPRTNSHLAMNVNLKLGSLLNLCGEGDPFVSFFSLLIRRFLPQKGASS